MAICKTAKLQRINIKYETYDYRTMTSSNNTWVRSAKEKLRKLDKSSSNKPLCVYGCAAGEKSCYSR
ncbi:hypothetical protein H8356DRAFT_1343867 [Neocallimastix lanati (nom. inval.)]|nr:hypothetical protein H8356DRAFT_1343867 [Neocallimastix sp. JGI-2020a]